MEKGHIGNVARLRIQEDGFFQGFGEHHFPGAAHFAQTVQRPQSKVAMTAIVSSPQSNVAGRAASSGNEAEPAVVISMIIVEIPL